MRCGVFRRRDADLWQPDIDCLIPGGRAGYGDLARDRNTTGHIDTGGRGFPAPAGGWVEQRCRRSAARQTRCALSSRLTRHKAGHPGDDDAVDPCGPVALCAHHGAARRRVNPSLLGMSKVASEDSVRRALERIPADEGASCLHGHLDDTVRPLLSEPWVLDCDTTIKPLYGHQEGPCGGSPASSGR